MTVRITGRELLLVCLTSFACIESATNALPWPDWGRSQLENAFIAVLTGCVGVSVIRAAMRRDSTTAEPARPSSRERRLKQAVFFLLILVTPIVAFLIRKPR